MKKVVRVTEKDIEKMVQKIMKEESDLTPKGFRSVVHPTGGQLRDVSKVKASPIEKNPLVDRRIDLDIMQEISDRLYGPDSEEYLKAILELNEKFRARGGSYGHKIGGADPSAEAKRKAREQEINQRIR